LDTIDFKTTHNLVVSYPKAELSHRIVACLLDLLIMFAFICAIAFLFGSYDILIIILIIPFITFYHLLFEMYNAGQSIGKKWMRLRVVALDGGNPSLKSIFLRWAFRMIDVLFTFGSFAILSIYSSEKGQRLGDVLAGTTVVKTNVYNQFSFASLDSEQGKSFPIRYNNLNRYSDEEMLLVKKVLTRYSEASTDENGKLVVQLCQKFYHDLDIDKATVKDEVRFLKEILEEYIIVTR
jgi:uncharacterized RDD family membrane protein YckC